ncbi:MAG TPA: hypothetical protein VMH03_07635 [Terriglobales bacterium]|nr:hypothetical protein [Terriglobales bacterium]
MSGRESGRVGSNPPGPEADPDTLEVVSGSEHQNLEGSVAKLGSPEELHRVLDQAFDYRGDIRITRKDGSQIEGYVFDRRTGKSLADSYLRLLPKDGGPRVSIGYDEIKGLAFTGRDMAAGKGWETWVAHYWEKKAAGEKNISLAPEKLE